jgi:hypothetical protein
MSERYRDIAARSGRSFAAGRDQCLVCWMQIGETDEDALDRIGAWDLDIWKNFYASMGRRKVENHYFGSLVNSGLFVLGTIDAMRGSSSSNGKSFRPSTSPWVNHYAQMPKDAVLETLLRHVSTSDLYLSNEVILLFVG